MPDERTSEDRSERARDFQRSGDHRRLHRFLASFLFTVSPEINVGSFDRATRVAVGAFFLALVFVGPTYWGLLGILPIVTGLTGGCPLYRAFGVSTLSRRPEDSE